MVNERMTTTGEECLVHHRKSLSKFHQMMNQFRRLNEFNLVILQQLPKRCCSCHGQKGESSLSIDRLRELCQEIQSKSSRELPPPPPVKPKEYLILEYESTLSPRQRLYKFGRFVGRKGEYIRALETRLNISINILNDKSSKPFRQTMNKSPLENQSKDRNNVCLLITINEIHGTNFSQIKQTIKDIWKQIDVTLKPKLTIRSVSPLDSRENDFSQDGDTRWTTVRKSKNKRKEKREKIEEEKDVPPQPSVRPISMPKELPKHQKGQRK